MSKSTKSRNKLKLKIGILILLFVGSLFFVQSYIESKVKNLLSKELPENIQLQYEGLDINLLSGDIILNTISADFFNKDSIHTKIKLDELGIKDFGYLQYFINKRIQVEKIDIINPKITYNQSNYLTNKDSTKGKATPLNNAISIGEILVKNGELLLLQKDNDSLQLSAKKIGITLKEVKLDSNTILNKIPFTHDQFEFFSQNIFVDLGPFESLTLDTLSISERQVKMTDLAMNTKYSRKVLSSKIRKERDHIKLNIEEISFDELDFGFNKRQFFIKSTLGTIVRPELEIYRDKLVADDLGRKRLYSQMLRELPIDLSLSRVAITNGHISYESLINANTKLGGIVFEKIEAELLNISNSYPVNEKTSVTADAFFMDSAPITLNWSFDVNNTNDNFLASGTFKHLKASSINPFLESNMRSQAKGNVDEIYFTISGNASNSTGEMKMKYSDFEFVILKKNRLGINRFLTTIGKIFVNKGSKADEHGFRYGKIEAERDPTKSFFNYLWLNVRNGLGSTLTGNGEKKK